MSAVVVLGRSDFQTGIGTVSAAACELFSRSFDVGFASHRETGLAPGDSVVLPTGRTVPVVAPEGAAVYFYTDVLWNGYSDRNAASIPDEGYRIAHLAYDSDELPEEWVRLLNERFHLALFSSEYLVEVARRSGVTIPIGVLPIGLDLEPLLARRYRAPSAGRIRIGTVSAYHSRKGLDLLVEAFLSVYGNDPSVELVIHSNLQMGDTFSRVSALAADAPAGNIRLSSGNLSDEDKNGLIESLDVYVNVSAGEGYSIGPREALALGKPLVLSDIPAHHDLLGLPGVFPVAGRGRRPALYPEIENRVFGSQAIIPVDGIAAALSAACAFARTREVVATAPLRRERAAEFSYSRLSTVYRELLDPQNVVVRPERPRSQYAVVPAEARAAALTSGGRHGRRMGPKKVIVPAHDGGFFSIFNVFLSNLVWRLQDDDVSLVLPDWDATRLIERQGDKPVVSYCYSRPEDGNGWLGLFEPMYDLSADEMNDAEFLYGGSELPETPFNQDREPLLTYVNAHDLYLSPGFQRVRRQYRAVLDRHIRLRPELRAEVDGVIAQQVAGRYSLGVHVKHPAHAIEQPGEQMHDRYAYLERVRQELRTAGIRESDEGWAVFLATDQERVVNLFLEEFGDHVVSFDDVARTSSDTDELFDTLSATEKLADGHQLQHQRAADTATWSSRLAWEVWRDAEVMASCTTLIHAVSNVATAASFLGPEVEMKYFSV